MKIFSTVIELQDFLDKKTDGASVGFVPTMGALHQGHLALVSRSKNENRITVCSIFVNPTQFNNPSDLENYPRTVDKDIELLQKAECDVLFLPTVKEVYPDNQNLGTPPDLGAMLLVMEGKHRPGHFNGVMTVVKRFFDIVKPNKAYFGEKDFQQLRIIQAMVEKLNMKVQIIPCPTIREKSGLAMSSRNTKLSAGEMVEAEIIPHSLLELQKKIRLHPEKMNELLQDAIRTLNAKLNGKLEYLNIIDEKTLENANKVLPGTTLRACIAAYVGKIRLIDNISI